MNKRARGFGRVQALLIAAALASTTLAAFPGYQTLTSKARVAEAVELADVSKRTMAQGYMVSGSFPRSEKESENLLAALPPGPDHVREIRIEHNRFGDSVTIKVFLEPGVINGVTGEDPYLYVSGFRTQGGTFVIEWRCGAIGISPELLPEHCQG